MFNHKIEICLIIFVLLYIILSLNDYLKCKYIKNDNNLKKHITSLILTLIIITIIYINYDCYYQNININSNNLDIITEMADF
jgi:amino acid permease